MLSEVLQYLRNWFEQEKYFGKFTISDGVVSYSDGRAVPMMVGQYFRIVGSVFNDGIHVFGDADLLSEDFKGAVWILAIPPDLLSIIEEIQTWTTTNADAINSPYQSESFGGYSYSTKSGANGSITWQSQFADRLSPWRKI